MGSSLEPPARPVGAEPIRDEPLGSDGGSLRRLATALLQAEMKTETHPGEARTGNTEEQVVPQSLYTRPAIPTAKKGGQVDEFSGTIPQHSAAGRGAPLPPEATEGIGADDAAFDRLATALLEAEIKQEQSPAANSQGTVPRTNAEHPPQFLTTRLGNPTTQEAASFDRERSRAAAKTPASSAPEANGQQSAFEMPSRAAVLATSLMNPTPSDDDIRQINAGKGEERPTTEDRAPDQRGILAGATAPRGPVTARSFGQESRPSDQATTSERPRARRIATQGQNATFFKPPSHRRTRSGVRPPSRWAEFSKVQHDAVPIEHANTIDESSAQKEETGIGPSRVPWLEPFRNENSLRLQERRSKMVSPTVSDEIGIKGESGELVKDEESSPVPVRSLWLPLPAADTPF